MSFLKSLTKQDKFIALFILKAVCLYLIWYFIYDKWLLKDGLLDYFLIDHLVASTAFIIKLLGYPLFLYADAVGIDGTHGVYIAPDCNGMAMLALFTGFVIAFPGKIKHKLFFIPIGLLIQLSQVH